MPSLLRCRAALALLLALLAGLAWSTPGHATSRLQTGFVDNGILTLPGAERADWLGRIPQVGGSMIRVSLFWSRVAPNRPPAASGADPNWPGYDFSSIDDQLRAADAAGLRVLLNVSTAPRWAEGPGKTTRNREGDGSWMPDASAFGTFMSAVAKRYSGGSAPTVDAYQLWNEPNLNLYLSPQFDTNGKPFAAVRFRDLVNAGYDAVKAASPGASIVAGGLAPYGDPGTTGYRSRPVAFLRSMLCLGTNLKPTCNVRTRLDAISLHPYAVDRPTRSALNGDDATIPDVRRITAVTKAARRAKTVGPKPPSTWVTEVSYDSSPPDPDGVPSATRARYIAKTQQLLWSSGVRTMLWYLLRDEAPKPSYAATYQSGMYLRSGRAKPDALAFRFPVVILAKSTRRLKVWWRSPAAGRARIQVLAGATWLTVKRTTATVDGVQTSTIPRRGATAVRVRVDGGVVSYVAAAD